MCNFLTATLLRWHPPAPTEPPYRIAHISNDSPCNFCVVNGGSSVSTGITFDFNLGTQLCSHFRGIKFDLKFRAFVFFDTDRSSTRRSTFNSQSHVSHEPITGCDHAAIETAVIIGSMFFTLNQFSVTIREQKSDIAISNAVVVVGICIH